jgi:hypothetical protein
MAGMTEEQLDRFARGELPPLASRELARQALANPDRFDELTATAIARRGLAASKRAQITRPVFVAAAAAMIGLVLLMPRRTAEPVSPRVAIPAPPALLAGPRDPHPAAFRGADSETREPRAIGSIGSIADGIATIDLGSIDGLAKGDKVDVIRGDRAIGQIELTTIFRDRSRGEIAGGASIGLNDPVRVRPSARLRAILDRIAAALARGEAEQAMRIARQASVESFDAELSSYEDWNNAGVIAELHGDRAKAGELYRRALQASRSAQDRRVIEQNVARLKGAK